AAFHAQSPARALPALTGYCSTAVHELTAFDKRSRQISEVIPTGRAPWGLALDPLRNRAYVALSGEDRILVLDIITGDRIADVRLQPGDAPRDLAFTPD